MEEKEGGRGTFSGKLGISLGPVKQVEGYEYLQIRVSEKCFGSGLFSAALKRPEFTHLKYGES